MADHLCNQFKGTAEDDDAGLQRQQRLALRCFSVHIGAESLFLSQGVLVLCFWPTNSSMRLSRKAYIGVAIMSSCFDVLLMYEKKTILRSESVQRVICSTELQHAGGKEFGLTQID